MYYHVLTNHAHAQAVLSAFTPIYLSWYIYGVLVCVEEGGGWGWGGGGGGGGDFFGCWFLRLS